MPPDYKFTKLPYRLVDGGILLDSNNGYELHFHQRTGCYVHVHFKIPWNNGSPLVKVTDRDHLFYRQLKDIPIAPHFQYLEVGAGLGGFIPYVMEESGGLEKKPIVIDPVDYRKLHSMLSHATGLCSYNELRDRLKKLVNRCEFYLDSEKIKLIGLPLHMAIESHPELIGIADFVIDNFGATFWNRRTMNSNSLEQAPVRELEAMLSKVN